MLLKVSGEALAGRAGFGIDAKLVVKLAAEVAEMAVKGVQASFKIGLWFAITTHTL